MRHKDSNTQLLEHESPPLTTRPGQPPVFLTSLPTVPKQKQCNMGLSTRSRSSWARRRFTRPNWIRSWSKSLLIWARICLSRSYPERLSAPMTSMKVPTLGQGAWQLSGDEGSYLPKFQTISVIALHALSILFCNLKNTTAYHLGR